MSRPLVTVNSLLTQLREHGAVELPADALVTPAARDWLRGARVTIRPTAATTPAPAAPPPPTHYLIADPALPLVQTLLPPLQRRHGGLQLLPTNHDLKPLLAAVLAACRGLGGCTQRRGVALVRDGAFLTCLANRHAKVRAAILAAPTALYRLQHELGVNLLIIELDRLSLQQTRAALEAFLDGPTHLAPEFEDALRTMAAQQKPCGCTGCSHGGTCGSSGPCQTGGQCRPGHSGGSGGTPCASHA